MTDGSPILTAAAMRDAETRSGVSTTELMARAGKAVADQVARFAMRRPILVLAGPDNNGGDGYVAARLLAERGLDVTVAALGKPDQGAAGEARRAWTGPIVAFDEAEPRPVLVDALFGTGLSRPLARDIVNHLQRFVDAAEFTLAVDLPSGVDTDSGDDLGAADGIIATLALGAYKPAHVAGPAAGKRGHLLLADISLSAVSEWSTIGRPHLAPPPRDNQKYSRGMVVVVAGAMPGAARLAARAALHGGAGYVVLAGAEPDGPDALVHRAIPSPDDLRTLLDDDRIGAVLIGPGLGRDDRARALLDAALASPHPLVVDGDALTLLRRDAAPRLSPLADVAVTPHAGEFARMFGAPEGGKIQATLAAARAIDGCVVHKGADTVIATPDGQARVNTNGSSWLSTAGTGDTLAGILAARRATGLAFSDAAAQAVWLHARSAQLAGPAFIADQLADHLPGAIAECL